MSKVELVTKTIGVNSYMDLGNEEIIAAVARHGTIKKDNGKLVVYLMNHAHWSPLQHISFGFKIQTRRSISAQMFRHRSIHGQEWSLRYAEPIGFEEIELRREHPVNRQSSAEVFEPLVKENGIVKYSQLIKEHFEHAQWLYNKGIELGVARECARDILPLATTTIIHFTGSFRDLLGFMNVRCDEHAQKEIRDIATAMGEALEKELPEIMGVIDWRNGMFM